MPWLDRAGAHRVEHVPCPNPGQPVDLHAPPKGIMHTTEGSFEGSLAVFRQHFAPHFMVGRDARKAVRILQLVPLETMAAALENRPGGVETNRVCRAQIELVGFSKHELWLPEQEVAEALAALMLALRDAAGIPLRHVIAGRKPDLWVKAAGWLGHIDVPENSHWDPGNLDWHALLKLAAPTDDRPQWAKDGDKLAPMWAWFLWKDHGAPPALRPKQVPARVPMWWWARYRLHRGNPKGAS
jgi:N-acetylmuramoyl-L-alanine amidase